MKQVDQKDRCQLLKVILRRYLKEGRPFGSLLLLAGYSNTKLLEIELNSNIITEALLDELALRLCPFLGQSFTAKITFDVQIEATVESLGEKEGIYL